MEYRKVIPEKQEEDIYEFLERMRKSLEVVDDPVQEYTNFIRRLEQPEESEEDIHQFLERMRKPLEVVDDPIQEYRDFIRKLEEEPASVEEVEEEPAAVVVEEEEPAAVSVVVEEEPVKYNSWMKSIAMMTSRGLSQVAVSTVLDPFVGTLAAPVIASKLSGMGFDIIKGYLRLDEKVIPSILPNRKQPPVSAKQVEKSQRESRSMLSCLWRNGTWMVGNLAALASASTISALAMNLLTGEGFKLGLDILSGNWMGATWRSGKLMANHWVRTKIYQILMSKLGTTTIGGATGKAVHKILSSPIVGENIRKGKPIPESARKALRKVLKDKTPKWVDATFSDLVASITKEGVDASVAYAVNKQLKQVNHQFEEIMKRFPDQGISETIHQFGKVASESAEKTIQSLQDASQQASMAIQQGVSKGMDWIYGEQGNKTLEDVQQTMANEVGPKSLKDIVADRIQENPNTSLTAKEMAENETLFSLWDQKKSLQDQLDEKQSELQILKTDQIEDQLQEKDIQQVQEQIQDLEMKLEVTNELEQAVDKMGGLKIKALKGVEFTALGLPVTQKAFSGLFKLAGKTAERFHQPLAVLQERVDVVKMSTGKKWIRELASGRLVSQELFEDKLLKTQDWSSIPWKAPAQIGDLGKAVGTATALEAFGNKDLLKGTAIVLGPEGVKNAIQGAAQLSKSATLQNIAASFNPFSLKLQAARGIGKMIANTGEWMAEGEQNMFIEGIGIASTYVNQFLDMLNIAALEDEYLGIPKTDLQKIARKVFLQKFILPTGKTNAEIINDILSDVAWGTVPEEEQGAVRNYIESFTLSILKKI